MSEGKILRSAAHGRPGKLRQTDAEANVVPPLNFLEVLGEELAVVVPQAIQRALDRAGLCIVRKE